MSDITLMQALANLAPTSVFTMADPNNYSTLIWRTPDIPQPTEAQAQAQQTYMQEQQPIDDCKKQASELLYETDWTTIPDIIDPTKSNPYLGNQADYIVYRNALRQLAVYPVANPVWPTKPTTVWINA